MTRLLVVWLELTPLNSCGDVFMFKHLFCFVASITVSVAALAVNTPEYTSVNIEANVNGKMISHSAIVEVGKKARVTLKPNDISIPATRIDYSIDKIGAVNGNEAVAYVSAMLFSSTHDGSWVLANDLNTAVKMGNPATIKSSSKDFNADVNLSVTTLSKEQVMEKLGGKIPPSSSCDGTESLSSLSAKYQSGDCCGLDCGTGSSSTLFCCGVIWCCERSGGPDCCCAP